MKIERSPTVEDGKYYPKTPEDSTSREQENEEAKAAKNEKEKRATHTTGSTNNTRNGKEWCTPFGRDP